MGRIDPYFIAWKLFLIALNTTDKVGLNQP